MGELRYYAAVYTYFCITITYLDSAVFESSLFNSIILPTEHLERSSTGRSAEWFKRFKEVTSITSDDDMTLDKSVTVSRSLVGQEYTISALVPADHNTIYLLRRRQDNSNGRRPFSYDGTYDRLNEGAITDDCIIHLNLTSSAVITSSANNTFYFPNAMVRDPQQYFWVSDAARHQVLRLDPSTLVPDISIGKQFAPGRGTTRLCAPNDVAVTSRHVYVADGQCNDRVVMFFKNGTYLNEFGKAPSPRVFGMFNYDQDRNQLATSYLEKPVSIAVDEEFDRLYVSESSQTRILLVKAGGDDPATLGTVIRYFQHSQLRPVAGRIAIHPRSRTVLAINSYSNTFINRGFSFNTHDTTFNGAWCPDNRGFVRPRTLAVTADGSVVYVADACQDSPEKIWIFNRTENPRLRRHTNKINIRQREKGDNNHIAPFIEEAQPTSIYPSTNNYNMFRNTYRYFSGKGQHTIRQFNKKTLKVP